MKEKGCYLDGRTHEVVIHVERAVEDFVVALVAYGICEARGDSFGQTASVFAGFALIAYEGIKIASATSGERY